MKVIMSLAAGCAMSVVVTSRVLSQASSPNDDPGFQAFLRQFEYLVMKHVQTADGAWADLVVGEGGQPLRFFLEPAENAAQPGAEAKGFGLIAGLGNLVLLGDDFRHSGRSHLPL